MDHLHLLGTLHLSLTPGGTQGLGEDPASPRPWAPSTHTGLLQALAEPLDALASAGSRVRELPQDHPVPKRHLAPFPLSAHPALGNLLFQALLRQRSQPPALEKAYLLPARAGHRREEAHSILLP